MCWGLIAGLLGALCYHVRGGGCWPRGEWAEQGGRAGGLCLWGAVFVGGGGGGAYWHAICVCSVDPTRRRNGDQRMAEIYKHINAAPLCQPVVICIWAALGQRICMIIAVQIMTDQQAWSLCLTLDALCLHRQST